MGGNGLEPARRATDTTPANTTETRERKEPTIVLGAVGCSPATPRRQPGYGTKEGAEKGIESVKTNAPGAAVVDRIEELVQRNTGAWAVPKGDYSTKKRPGDG